MLAWNDIVFKIGSMENLDIDKFMTASKWSRDSIAFCFAFIQFHLEKASAKAAVDADDADSGAEFPHALAEELVPGVD